jgi:5-methyltetrahydrofolate--homocysteine methyltransferase
MRSETKARIAALPRIARERILVLDGSWGVMLQGFGLTEEDYRGERFSNWPRDLKGNHDLLCVTRPDLVRDISLAYLEAGADIISTNSFTATSISLADYGCESHAAEINLAAARVARAACDSVEAKDRSRPRFVAGSIGPTNKTASISPDVNDPAFRNVTFDELRASYAEVTRALIQGGSDLLLIETVFDTLNG